jgi:hypothetical protein
MSVYSDDDIRNMKRISCKIAGDYLGIASTVVSMGMRNGKLPIGFAELKHVNRYHSETWSYNIIPERLIAYKYGKLNEFSINELEKNLQTIIMQFEEFKKGLIPLLKGIDKK